MTARDFAPAWPENDGPLLDGEAFVVEESTLFRDAIATFLSMPGLLSPGWEIGLNRMLKKSFCGLFQRRNRKMPFFNGLLARISHRVA